MQKLSRAVIGTNNVDNCSSYCQSPATDRPVPDRRLRRRSGSIADIEGGAGGHHRQQHRGKPSGPGDPGEEGAQASRAEADRLDLREHEMARRADLFLHPEAPDHVIWLSAVSRYLLDHGLARTEFLSQWTTGLDEYRKSRKHAAGDRAGLRPRLRQRDQPLRRAAAPARRPGTSS